MRGRNGGHIKPPLHHDYRMLKKKIGVEQAKKLIRFRLMHIDKLKRVAVAEDILKDCQCREVESLDVFYSQKTFDEAKALLKVWKEDMPEESQEYDYAEKDEAIEVMFRICIVV